MFVVYQLLISYLFDSYNFQFISIKHCMEQLNTLKKRVWVIQKRISSLTVSFNYFIINIYHYIL